MSILTVNLKHFYQRRGLWFGYLMIGLFVFASIAFPLDNPKAGEGTFIGFNVVALLVGLMVAVMQMEVIIRPFAFGLPRHRQMVRKLIFLVAIVTSALSSLIFLLYPGLSVLQLPLVICSAFFAGMIFYLAGTWWAFGLKQPIAFIGFAMCALFLGQFINLHVLLEAAIVDYPVVVIPLGILAGVAMWLRLGDSSLARRNCQMPWIGFDSFNWEKVRRRQTKVNSNRWKQLKDHPRPWVENLFINTMSRQNPLSGARILWGTLYTSLGLSISQWRNGVWGSLFMAVFLGYFGPRTWIALSFIPIVAVSTSRPILYSHMLIAGGRRERFYSTLTLGLVAAATIALFVAIVILISMLLATFMPEIGYHGLKRAYSAVGPGAFYAPLVVLPFAYAVSLLLYKKTVAVIVIFMSVYFAVVSVLMTSGALAVVRGTLPATCIAILSWLIFVLVSHRVSARYCLVK